MALVVGSFLGLRREHSTLLIDPVMPRALDGLQATVELAGQAVEVVYRLGPAGCGPLRLELDGQPLGFERRANPYRVGAAAVPVSALASTRSAPDGQPHRLVVHTG
jgi:cellobiose phosphorylase